MLKLYDYFRSSACYRVRIALNLKQLDYRLIPIHLVNHGGEHLSDIYTTLNPQNLVPAMEAEDKILTQSLAMIEYLDELYPKPALLPSNPFERAIVRSYAYLIACDIHPLNNLRVLKYLKDECNLSDEEKSQWYKHWIQEGLEALENLIVKHQLTGDYCVGFVPTLADICLIPQLYNAHRFKCDLTQFPHLTRIENNCKKLTAFEYAYPKEPVKLKEKSYG